MQRAKTRCLKLLSGMLEALWLNSTGQPPITNFPLKQLEFGRITRNGNGCDTPWHSAEPLAQSVGYEAAGRVVSV